MIKFTMKNDIKREAAKPSALSSGKIDKYEYLTGDEILPSDQSRIIEQAKFTYSPLSKTFEKQVKKIEEQGKKQIEILQIKTKVYRGLTNKDHCKSVCKEIFEKLVKERIDEVIELTDEINQNGLIYYFKGNISRKRFDDFTNGIKLFEKIRSGKMKLEEPKKLQNVFKSNVNEMSKGKFKSKEKENAVKKY